MDWMKFFFQLLEFSEVMNMRECSTVRFGVEKRTAEKKKKRKKRVVAFFRVVELANWRKRKYRVRKHLQRRINNVLFN
jgi:uncharacterized membrane protein